MKYHLAVLAFLLSAEIVAQDSLAIPSENNLITEITSDSTKQIRFDRILKSMTITESNRFSTSFTDSLEKTKKNPWFSFFVSTVFPIPGTGQIYNGDNMKATVQSIGFLTGYILVINAANGTKGKNGLNAILALNFAVPQIAFGNLLFYGSKIWSMIDAPTASNSYNKTIDEKIARYKYIKQTIYGNTKKPEN